LSYVPLPDWKNLLYLFHPINKISNKDLAIPWENNHSESYWFSKSAWALLAIAKYRMIITGNKNINVWLPDYFCNESTTPLRENKIKINFYPILSDGKPDIEICNEMLKKNKPDLFIVVHYFGEKTDTTESVNFAKQHNAWFIEDAAHILLPYDELGEIGDFVFFSPHKLLPIPDGSLLVINNNGPSKIIKGDFKKYKLDHIHKLVSYNRRFIPPQYIWLIKRVLQKLGFNSIKNTSQSDFYNSNLLNKKNSSFITPKMSKMAKKLLFITINNLNQEIDSRNKCLVNWIRYLKLFNHINFDNINIIEIKNPYMVAINFINPKEAKNTYYSLLESRIPVVTWPDLAPEILFEKNKYRTSIHLSHSRVFLPINRTTNKNIEKYLHNK